jgi:hypothetical protein
LVNVNLTAHSLPHLVLDGPINRSYRFEYQDNFGEAKGWNPLATVFVTQTPFSFTDTNSAGRTQRFYRAVLLP